MLDRYIKNKNMISQTEQSVLRDAKVCVIGCGGLGGYIVEFLARLGVGSITIVDGDKFDVSNLNRQLLCLESNIGQYKVIAAQKRIALVNSKTKVAAITEFIDEYNMDQIIKGHDLVIDALDTISIRKRIQKCTKEHNIPLIHGAIAGWYGQVCTIMPGDDSLDFLYANEGNQGIEKELGNPSFTPALIASIEVSEALKILINKGELIRNQVLHIDLLEAETYKVPLK